MNIGCLSKIHFGCSVEVIKDHYQVICEIYSVVDKNQKKILTVKVIEFEQYKFNHGLHSFDCGLRLLD